MSFGKSTLKRIEMNISKEDLNAMSESNGVLDIKS